MRRPQLLLTVLVLSISTFFLAACSAGPAASANARSEVVEPDGEYRSPNEGFILRLPSGWSAKEVEYSVMHYRDVFLCVNSEDPSDLRITNERHENGESYSLGTVKRQLPAGATYMDFAYFEGPAGVPRYSEDRADTVGRDLHALLDKSTFRNTKDGTLSYLKLAFVKWGQAWSIFAYVREPATADSKEQLMAILRTFRFEEVPVVNAVQAVGRALERLPLSVRREGEWPACNGTIGQDGVDHSTAIERVGADFRVTFSRVREGPPQEERAVWEYLVRADGSVVDVVPRAPNKSLKATR